MKNWAKSKLNEVCKIGDGNHSSNYPKSSEMVSEGVPFIRANNMVNGTVVWADLKFITTQKHEMLKKGHLKTGDILFTNRGEIGKIAIVGSDFNNANLNSQIAWFRCLERIDNRFLFYFLSSPSMQNHYSVEKNGAALQQFTIRQINEIEIPLPPLPEQQRIVAILDTAFSAIAKAKSNAEQNLKNAKQLFESYLQGVFENGDWETKTIAEVCDEIFAGGDAPKNNFSLEENDKYKIPIYANAVKYRGLYGYTDAARVTKPSITISARGSGTGHTEIRFDKYLPIVRLIVLIPNLSLINLEFLKHSIDNLDILRSGSAIPQLTVPMIKEYNLPLPSLEQQDKIVQKLTILQNETQKLEAIYQQKIIDLEELKKSVLQKAFAGQLSNNGKLIIENGKLMKQ